MYVYGRSYLSYVFTLKNSVLWVDIFLFLVKIMR
jgi:hypothetical protein